VRLGIDIGGTFTDFVLLTDGALRIHKVLTTPDRVGGVLQGLQDLGLDATVPVVHGSTVATNALLERRGARTALVTTGGFGDVLLIGRQTRPSLFDLAGTKPPPLVPPERTFEVAERVDYQGQVLIPLDDADLAALVERVRAADVEAIAVSLLFAFANPTHEQRIGAALEALGVPISLSHRVLPEYREYERTSTVTINAYVAPLIARYVEALGQHLGPLRIMQSSGGSISARVAAAEPVRTVLSGPAAGVVGAFWLARTAGFAQCITFDMGGTSTDVSLCPGEIQETSEGQIAGLPIRVPIIDIHTVGAGGGSLARLDAGGALVVGPESAGANPGPVAYGRGGQQPTVTDANVVLGRLPDDYFLGGRMALDVPAATAALGWLGAQMGRTPAEAAEGVVRVANSNMDAAIRVISVQRGYDPRDFTLVAFGGAGPLHAADLATALRIGRVLVPRYPGVLSALGLLVADVVKDYSQTVMLPAGEATAPRLDALFAPLEERGWAELRAEGFAPERIRAERWADLRYVGQSFELRVPLRGDFRAAFDALHARRFGHQHPDWPVELVNLRLKMVGLVEPPPLAPAPLGPADASAARLGTRAVVFDGRPTPTMLYARAGLAPGHAFAGPAVVVQDDTTTVVPPGWTARVDAYHNLLLEYA
jgi:N-methylhydantoinase A